MAATVPYQSKSLRELAAEAGWFALHTGLAVLSVAAILAAGALLRPTPEAILPKLIGTGAAFVLPLLAGLAIAKWQPNDVAPHVWIAGLLLFASVCVWVLDLPTGPGMCDQCGAVDKLWRTFFAINRGSGLMGGDGLVIGVWIPLALFAYAMGAGIALERQGES